MKKLICLVLALFFFASCGGSLTHIKPIEKDGEIYGSLNAKARWWHYYNSALSFAEGGFFKETEDYFLEALKIREKDQKRARTYGHHFIDYFPNRELGIIFYKTGDYKNAEKYLDISLEQCFSKKAEKYKLLLEK